MVTVNILDASALIRKGIPKGKNITEEEVYQEIKDKKSKLEMDLNSINVYRAKSNYVEKINEISPSTGDAHKLSSPDKRLLALALEQKKTQKNIKLFSDDYAIQNICEELDIPYEGIMQKEIDKKIDWIQICIGCKKEIENKELEECPYCGQKLKLVPKREKDLS
ncbi:ribonuclease VapC [archaeon SCG-AAA382B04]|nr:ribonuclease VapC [archaeon SCG-AAA382B04]